MVRGDKTELISVRLNKATIDAVDDLAKEYSITRAEVIRSLLENSKDCYPMIRAKRLNEYPEIVKAENELAENMVDTLPDGTTPEHLYILGAVFSNVGRDMLRVGAEEVSKKGGKELRELIKDAIAKASE
jgi:CRISPR/Cas system-associated protein Cas10 (large subunit of type III CRISPR-Cas system)